MEGEGKEKGCNGEAATADENDENVLFLSLFVVFVIILFFINIIIIVIIIIIIIYFFWLEDGELIMLSFYFLF